MYFRKFLKYFAPFSWEWTYLIQKEMMYKNRYLTKLRPILHCVHLKFRRSLQISVQIPLIGQTNSESLMYKNYELCSIFAYFFSVLNYQKVVFVLDYPPPPSLRIISTFFVHTVI